MKYYLLTLFFCASLQAFDADYGAPFNEEKRIDAFRQLFQVKTYLEFGAGVWTEYFLENSNKVISIEFVTPGYGAGQIQGYLKTYSNYSNWIPLVYFSAYTGDINWAPYKYQGSEHVHKAASHQCSTHENYALLDNFYLTELDHFITGLAKYNKPSLAFVNSGLYIRGDLVQLLFDKVPVIIASDTDCRAAGIDNDVYGYSRIATPENYEEIYISEHGLTVWVKVDKNHIGLIQDLFSYRMKL